MATKEQLWQAIEDKATESEGRKRLNCTQAFEIAHECNVGIRQIGDLCNENNVRICNCQLGCFQ